jgi:hypothetical protein
MNMGIGMLMRKVLLIVAVLSVLVIAEMVLDAHTQEPTVVSQN